jgi:hypothetical protein
MLGRRFKAGFACLVLAFACGGKSGEDDSDGSGGRFDGFGGDGMGGTTSRGGRTSSGGTGAGGAFVDPGCPNLPPPPARIECDAFGDSSDCPVGNACYPFVDHPFGNGCGVEVFGARCVFAGQGTQGDFCGDGTEGCAAGFLCVLGGHAGRHCERICGFDGKTDCPVGLICHETDIIDVGVCG